MRPTPLSLRCAVRFRVVFPPPNYFTAAASIFYSSFALLMDPSQSIGYIFEPHEPRRHVDGPQVQVWDLYAYSPFGTEIDLSWQEYGESWTTAAYVTISGGGDLFFADAGVHSLGREKGDAHLYILLPTAMLHRHAPRSASCSGRICLSRA